MRDFAEKNLSWDVKIRILLSFLKQLAYMSKKKEEPYVVFHKPDLFSALLEESCFTKYSLLEQLLVKAAVLRENGDRTPAAVIYKDIMSKSKKPMKYLFRVLVELEQLIPEEFDLLAQFSNQILQLYSTRKRPDFTESYRLASLYKKTGQLENARKFFEKALELDKRSILKGGIYFHLGEICMETGEPQEAENMFRLCLKYIPRHQKAALYLNNKMVNT